VKVPFSRVAKISVIAFVFLIGYVDWVRKENWRKAGAIWIANLELFEWYAAGRGGSVEEFESVCRFFFQLTGVRIPVDRSATLGLYPIGDLAESVKQIRQWHDKNSEGLYWNEQTRTVELRPK
jgi:hypothetical protein